MDPNRVIRRMLGVKRGDTLPFKGWSHTSTRRDLHRIFAKLGYARGAEIGVASGRHARALVDALRKLITDGAMRRRMGSRGRDLVVEKFSADQVIRETLAVYDGVE